MKKYNNATQKPTGVKKKKFDFEKFIQQWNTLDPQNYGGWPYAIKITIWVFILLLINIVGYLIVIQPQIEKIENARGQEVNLLEEFRKKESKLRHLEQYQTQLNTMQENFNHILLEPEMKQEFLIEQPISIEATGDYHAFGSFISAIALLPRIVTLHDFSVTTGQSPKQRAGIPFITYAIRAKTYRYVDDQHQRAAQEEEKK